LSSSTKTLLEWLPIEIGRRPEEARDHLDSITELRKKLAKSAHDRIFAEKRVGDEFLDTSPLRALAADNISQLPIAVIVGAKGAGKTFTFLQQARIGTWKQFVDAVIKQSPEIDAPMSPALFSLNLGEDALKLVTDAGRRASHSLGFEDPISASA